MRIYEDSIERLYGRTDFIMHRPVNIMVVIFKQHYIQEINVKAWIHIINLQVEIYVKDGVRLPWNWVHQLCTRINSA